MTTQQLTLCGWIERLGYSLQSLKITSKSAGVVAACSRPGLKVKRPVLSHFLEGVFQPCVCAYVAACLFLSLVVTLAGCGGGDCIDFSAASYSRHSSHDHDAAREQDGGARRDRDFLSGRNRQHSFVLPVAEEPGSNFRCDLGQLHHPSGNLDGQRCPVPSGGEQFRGQCYQRFGNLDREQYAASTSAPTPTSARERG